MKTSVLFRSTALLLTLVLCITLLPMPPVLAKENTLVDRLVSVCEPDTSHPLSAACDGNLDTFWWSNGWGGTFETTNTEWKVLKDPIDIVLTAPTDLQSLTVIWAIQPNGQTFWDGENGHRYRSNNYAIWVSKSYTGEDFVRVDNVGVIDHKDSDAISRYRNTTRIGEKDIHTFVGQTDICRIRIGVPPESEINHMGNRLSIAEIEVQAIPTPGDVNNDGKISTKDAVATMRHIVGDKTTITKAAADVDGDGEIRVLDAVMMARHIAGGYSVTLLPHTPAEKPLRFEQDGITYYNVTRAAKDAIFSGDDDRFFPAGEEGYYIQDGVYELTPEHFDLVRQKAFVGDGAIKWNDWENDNYTPGDTHLFDGILYISKMDDPLYVAMCLHDEAYSYMNTAGSRYNSDTLVNPKPEHDRVLSIGAVYLNPANAKDLPDDTKVTLCFGRMTCVLKMKGEDWKLVNEVDHPYLRHLYPLPWTIGDDSIEVVSLPSSRVQQVGDHWEVSLTVGDFRRHEGDDERLDGRVFHFWGENYDYPDGKTGADVEGIVTSYEVWVKEPEMSGMLAADIGADQRGGDGVDQAFTGITYSVTSEKRVIFGHDVCPDCYDTVMDSEKVQQLIGLK